MSRTAAEYMAKALEQAGVKRVYGVVGGSLSGFTDSLRRPKYLPSGEIGIDYFQTTHPV